MEENSIFLHEPIQIAICSNLSPDEAIQFFDILEIESCGN